MPHTVIIIIIIINININIIIILPRVRVFRSQTCLFPIFCFCLFLSVRKLCNAVHRLYVLIV